MIRREVNGYVIETRGGGSFVKRWVVLHDEEEVAVYFKYSEAKKAYETNDFSKGLEEDFLLVFFIFYNNSHTKIYFLDPYHK